MGQPRGSSDAAGGRIGVVVMLDSIERPGGAETLAMEGAMRLDPGEFDRTLCVTRWDDSLEVSEPSRTWLARLRASGVRLVCLRRSGRFAIWAWRPLIGFMRRNRTAVLHSHLFGSNVWASLLKWFVGRPVVVAHEHMWAYTGSRSRELIDRQLIARSADAFVAVSEEGRRRMIDVERIPADEIVLIPNGVPATEPGEGDRVRAEFGIPASAPIVGSVGHLRSEKAFEVLIEATPLLAEEHPGLRVLIAGEGPERPKLEALAAELGVSDRVLLPGVRNDVPDLLAAFDVAVCCSDFEGGPLSVMEYMGAGLPIVATRTGGLPELIDDGVGGLLVPTRDPQALAAAVDRVLADPALAGSLGAAAAERKRGEYDIDVWAARVAALYRRLLASRPNSA